jgi:hypothetical protein
MKNYKERFIKNFQKLSGVMLNESMLFEAESRLVYNDMLKMFQENDFKNGMFASLGYFNQVVMPKEIYPNEQNEMTAMELINAAQKNGLNDIEVKLIKELIGSGDWKDVKSGIVLTAKKQPKKFFKLSSDFPAIFKFERYIFNYMDHISLAKNFDDSRKSEIEVRRKYGFGKPKEEYPKKNWREKETSTGRLKYRGITLDPQIDPRDVNKGSSYKEKLGDFPLFGDVDMNRNRRIDPDLNMQRVAFKQNINANLRKGDYFYYLIESDGTMHQVTERFVEFFSGELKEVGSSKNIIDELEEDEAEFEKEVKAITNKYHVKQFLTHHIAFMSATVYDAKTKESKPIYYINDKLNKYLKVNINTSQLNDLINKYLKDSKNYEY